MWFFPEIPNGWSPALADTAAWFGLDLRHPLNVGSAELDFLSDGKEYGEPGSYRLQMLASGTWTDVAGQHQSPGAPAPNGTNEVSFPALRAQQFRVLLGHVDRAAKLRLVEFKLFAPGSAR